MKVLNFYWIFILLLYSNCQSKHAEKLNNLQILQNERWLVIWKSLDAQMADLMLSNEDIFEKLIDQKMDSAQQVELIELRSRVKRANKQLGFTKFFVYSNIAGEFDSLRYSLKKPFEYQKVQEFLVGNKDKQGEGYLILKEMQAFDSFMQKNYAQAFPLGYQPLASIKYSQMMNQLSKENPQDWVQRFAHTSAVEAIALLNELQIRVLAYENQLLKQIQDKLSKK